MSTENRTALNARAPDAGPETIKTYQGSSIGVSQCLVTLEGFIGDMDNAELADDSTVDTSDAVTAINALTWEMEKREAEIERVRAALMRLSNEVRATVSLAEQAIRDSAGNTNYQCLMDAESEARVALGK